MISCSLDLWPNDYYSLPERLANVLTADREMIMGLFVTKKLANYQILRPVRFALKKIKNDNGQKKEENTLSTK